MNLDFWKNKKVFITGHTGFKGGWTVMWLHKLGAIVKGYALELIRQFPYLRLLVFQKL